MNNFHKHESKVGPGHLLKMTANSSDALSSLTLLLHDLPQAALLISVKNTSETRIKAVNLYLEQLFNREAQHWVGASFFDYFEYVLTDSIDAQTVSTPTQLRYKPHETDNLLYDISSFTFPSEKAETLILVVLKTKLSAPHSFLDPLVATLHDCLTHYAFEEGVWRFVNHLVQEKWGIHASLWWSTDHEITEGPLTHVAEAGESAVLPVKTQRSLFFKLISEPYEPGFVFHDLEKGSIYVLPLYVENKVRGALFLVSHTSDQSFYALRFSRCLGQTLGVKLERKFLSQILADWVNYNPEPTLVSDTHGRLLQLNEAAYLLLPQVDDVLANAMHISDMVHPEEKEVFKALYDDLKPGKTLVFEGRCLNAEQEVIYVSWKMRQSHHHDHVYHVLRDVRHKNKLAQRLEQAYSVAKMGTWELELPDHKIYWSEVTREIHEIHEPTYQPALKDGINYYHPEDRATISKAVQDCVTHGKPWDLELRLVTAKGNERWVRSMGEGEFNNGVCQRVFGVFMDIDAKKRSEIRLHQQTRMLKLLNDTSQQFLTCAWQDVLELSVADYAHTLVLDLMCFVPFSQNEMHTTVYSHPEIICEGAFFAEIFNWVSSINTEGFTCYGVDKLPVDLRSSFEALEMAQLAIMPLRADGFLQGVLLLGASQSTTAGFTSNQLDFAKTFAHGLSQAIAKQKSFEALQYLNAELEEKINALAYSNQELEQFAYIASHDLQEPLRMVTSFLNQLEKKYSPVLDEKAHRYIYFATDGARRMRQIILDLLEYSRLGKPEQMVYEPIHTEDFIAEIQLLLSQKIKESHAEISYDMPSEFTLPRVPIRQVIQNLVGNALKYARPNTIPRIHLALKQCEHDWCFSVQDNGIGIESEYFTKIFILFQRLHSKDHYEGTGVGLALCKKIVEQCNGRIWVDSTPQQGSTFYFKIPVGAS